MDGVVDARSGLVPHAQGSIAHSFGHSRVQNAENARDRFMELNIKEVLNTAGPTMRLVFASWIFLQHVNQRYSASHGRSRALISELRNHANQDVRHLSIQQQALKYKRRRQCLRTATNISLGALYRVNFRQSGHRLRQLLVISGADDRVWDCDSSRRRSIESDETCRYRTSPTCRRNVCCGTAAELWCWWLLV